MKFFNNNCMVALMLTMSFLWGACNANQKENPNNQQEEYVSEPAPVSQVLSWSTRPYLLERSVETEFYSLEVS